MQKDKTLNREARIMGGLYLLLAIIAPFALLYVPSQIVDVETSLVTANKILENITLFRSGVAAETLTVLIEIFIVVLLYRLFKPVNKTLSLAAASLRLSMTIIQSISIIIGLVIIYLVTNQQLLSTLGMNQTNALLSLLLEAKNAVIYTWQLFFGVHLIVLGYLVIKSKYFPKVIGYLVIAASSGYLVDSYVSILFPTNGILITLSSMLLIVSTIGEITFTVWLITKGISKATKKSELKL